MGSILGRLTVPYVTCMSAVLGVDALTVLVIAWLLTVPRVDVDVSLSQLRIPWLLLYCNLYMHVPGMDIDISRTWSTYSLFHVWMCQLSLIWICELSHIIMVYNVPCMEMSAVPGVDGLVHALTASYNYGLHIDCLMCGCWLSQVWMYWLLQIWSLCWLC